MLFTPKSSERRKLPVFDSADKSLADALNTLARAIEAIEIPNVRIAGGTQDWSGNEVLLRPDKPLQSNDEDSWPWKPYYEQVGSVIKVGFHLGSLNNVIPSNWNIMHDLAITAGDFTTFHYAILTVSTDSGKVTGIVTSIEATAPETDTVSQDTPPAEFKVVLGAVGLKRSYMIEKTSLTFLGRVMFQESKAAPAIGAEPFHRWYAWEKADYIPEGY